jgi:hypothetical protein
MHVDHRAVLATVVALAACATGCTMAPKPVIVKCTMEGDQVDVVSLEPARGRATLLSVSPPLEGTSHATPSEYEASFQPGPEGAPRLHIKINRYTLRATREPGRHGGGAAAGTGSHSNGTCERFKGKPL